MTSDDTTAVLFDIDGTLVDSTYHHAIAWQRAFDRHDLPIPLWRIHRTVGMGGDKLVGEVAGDEVERDLGDALRDAWKEEYVELKAEVDPLPGAAELVRRLAKPATSSPWRRRVIPTSPRRPSTTSRSVTS